MFLWTGFLICTSAIFYSGTKLAKYGDIIAEKTGMGRTWTGLILMATVTSLPELMTGISSVAIIDVPDIAAGDVIGSCVFNMFILASLDAFSRQMPLSTKAHHGHVLSGSIGILLLSIAAISLYTGKNTAPLGWIGLSSLVFIAIYLLATKLIFIYERKQRAVFMKEIAVEGKYSDISKSTAFTIYGINAIIVIAAAVFLPGIGEGIAESTGLGQTFVGNIFIALSTSLPEVVVSVAAIKINAVDLAISNLFGSNIFNILILGIDDIFFIKGPILSFVDTNHIIPALSAIIMTTIAVIGLTYRTERKLLFLAWDSIAMVFVFIVNLMLLFMFK
jgi:cation:H+ antiporter